MVAGLAQLVEQLNRNQWVGSSNLLAGTIKKNIKKRHNLAVFY